MHAVTEQAPSLTPRLCKSEQLDLFPSAILFAAYAHTICEAVLCLRYGGKYVHKSTGPICAQSPCGERYHHAVALSAMRSVGRRWDSREVPGHRGGCPQVPDDERAAPHATRPAPLVLTQRQSPSPGQRAALPWNQECSQLNSERHPVVTH